MNVEPKREFEKLEREWSQAIVLNDAQAINRFMAEDWVIVGESGITEKSQFLRLVTSGDLTHEMMGADVKRLAIYGDIAVVTSRGINSVHYKGQPFSADEWITDVFVRRDGRWQ